MSFLERCAEYNRQTMKILIVANYYTPHLGGLEIVAKYQAEHLAGLGHEVTVVTSAFPGAEYGKIIENGVTIYRERVINYFDIKFGIPFPIPGIGFKLRIFREAKKADIIHVHDAFYLTSFIAAICARIYRTPLVLMQHVAMVNHPNKFVMCIQRFVYRTTGAFVLRIASRVISLNDRVEEFLLANGVKSERLIKLVNGVNMNLFHPATETDKADKKRLLGLDATKVTVLFVGRFVPKKGFHKLLEARDNGYQLAFCGGDRPVDIPADDNRAVFFGKVTPSEVAEIYRSADIFILPSEDEGFPLSVQEAMASGLPVVTSNDHGYARYGFNHELIFMLDNTDSETLRKVITALATDDEKRKHMSEYSLQYTKEHFEWSRVVNQLNQVYNELLS